MTFVRVMVGPTTRYIRAGGFMTVSTTTEVFRKNVKINEREQIAVMHETVHNMQLLSSPSIMHNENLRLVASVELLRSKNPDEAKAWAKKLRRLDAFYTYRHWFSLIGEHSRIVTVCLLHLFLTRVLCLILCIVGAEIMLQSEF